MSERKPPKQAAWYRYTDAASVGLEIAIAVAGCTVGAYYLEQYVTHWSPWTTLIGAAIGIGAAAKALVRTARNYQRHLAAERESALQAAPDSEASPFSSSAEASSPPSSSPH